MHLLTKLQSLNYFPIHKNMFNISSVRQKHFGAPVGTYNPNFTVQSKYKNNYIRRINQEQERFKQCIDKTPGVNHYRPNKKYTWRNYGAAKFAGNDVRFQLDKQKTSIPAPQLAHQNRVMTDFCQMSKDERFKVDKNKISVPAPQLSHRQQPDTASISFNNKDQRFKQTNVDNQIAFYKNYDDKSNLNDVQIMSHSERFESTEQTPGPENVPQYTTRGAGVTIEAKLRQMGNPMKQTAERLI